MRPENETLQKSAPEREAVRDGGLFSLRRLRWKLTLSYTLVTVLALLLAELALLAALVAFAASPVLPRLAAEDVMGSRVAPSFVPGLTEDPPDTGLLREEISRFVTSSHAPSGPREEIGGGLGFTLEPSDGYLLVVDGDRRLLATSRELPESPVGERLETGELPVLEPLLEESLSGGDDPWGLGAYSSGWEQMVVTAPVEGEEGEVLGAAVAVVDLPDPVVPLLVIAGVGAVILLGPAALLGTIFGLFTAWGLTRRVQRLAGAAQAWSRGDFSAVARDRSKDELGQLSRELNRMARELEGLIQTRSELATLEARNRFARDLHDSVKQQVFATSLQIAAANALVGSDPPGAGRHLRQADELIRQTQRELNALIHEMRPAALEDRGLAAAVREYAASWSRGSEVSASVRISGERETPLEVEQALFRVLQEALANAARHSGAGNVNIELLWEKGLLRMRVRDDGGGFAASGNPGRGLGLENMRERLDRLGGKVTIESEPGKGTLVECLCPLDSDREGGI